MEVFLYNILCTHTRVRQPLFHTYTYIHPFSQPTITQPTIHQPPQSEGRIEKYILRKAFDDPADPYLPAKILWRQKEQFSDGVGYGWIDALRDHAAAAISDQQFAAAANRFPHNPPQTKEAYYYREIFEEFYPMPSAAATVPGGPSIACSTPRAIEWDESFKGRADPSGRAVAAVHDSAYSADFNTTMDGAGPSGGDRGSPGRAGKRKAETQGGK